MVIDKWPEQCFILSEEVLRAVSVEEIDATWEDMKELELNKPPYEAFDVVIPSSIIQIVDEAGNKTPAPNDQNMRIRFVGHTATWLVQTSKGWINYMSEMHRVMETVMKKDRRLRLYQTHEDLDEEFLNCSQGIYRILIVMLATRNAAKTRKECKTLRLGIGSKERNRYTTTITIGKVTEQAEPSKPTGTKVRPHLRRGHIRRQHYGPGRQYVKQIFIEPVFVNADEGWIAERTAYNVGVQH